MLSGPRAIRLPSSSTIRQGWAGAVGSAGAAVRGAVVVTRLTTQPSPAVFPSVESCTSRSVPVVEEGDASVVEEGDAGARLETTGGGGFETLAPRAPQPPR